MELNIADDIFGSASSPDEAALLFKQAVSAGLASVIAKALSDVVGKQRALDASISGWESYVGGLHFDLAWAKPAQEIRPITQLCVFAPMDNVAFNIAGVNVSIGVSLTASF